MGRVAAQSKVSNKRNASPELAVSEDYEERMDYAIEFLKMAVVNDADMIEIQEKLTETMKYRHDLMKDARMDVKETFPFFFVYPELVSALWFNLLLLIQVLCFNLNQLFVLDSF